MKKETLTKLAELVKAERLKFEDVPEGLAVNHDLTDDELKELVQLEYGNVTQDTVALFTVMCKKLAKQALEK
jgi:hypothetical protein